MDTIERVAEYMREHDLILVTAESCTAGLIAATLADIPGAGQSLDCAFVVYSAQAKQQLLGVSQETLENFNLTSEQVAKEMAVGALKHPRANIAVSNTGVSDDTDKDIPPGTQCFAWAFSTDNAANGQAAVFTETRQFSGDRNAIRQASAEYALGRIPHYHQQLS